MNKYVQQENRNIIAIIEEIAIKLNENDICYNVTHGIEKYPNSLGRDIDVIVKSNQIKVALDIASNVLKSNGWTIVIHRKPWAYWLFAFNRNSYNYSFIEIDFFTYLQWGPVVLTRVEYPNFNFLPFKNHPWPIFVKQILIQLLGSDVSNLKKNMKYYSISDSEKPIIFNKLYNLCGVLISTKLINYLEKKDIKNLVKITPKLKRNIIFINIIRHPFKTFYLFLNWIKNELALSVLANPCAPIVAFVGPDGVGKSTVIEKLINILPESLPVPQILVKHWRPGLIPSIKQLFIGRQINGNAPVEPRRKPGRFFLFRLLYYYFDFLLGGWLVDRPAAATLKLILYDRCALDMVVDPVRFGLSSARGTKLLWKYSPKPDLVILLYDEPERIYKRKQELPVEEIARQLEVWFKLYQEKHVNALVKVDGAPDKIAEIIRDLIVEAFIKKNKPKN